MMNSSVLYLLLPLTLAILVSDVSCTCDNTSVSNCYNTFSDNVNKNNSASNVCREYTIFVDCLKKNCDTYLSNSKWGEAKTLLQKNGVNCNSGRNLQFSLVSGLLGILISILCKQTIS